MLAQGSDHLKCSCCPDDRLPEYLSVTFCSNICEGPPTWFWDHAPHQLHSKVTLFYHTQLQIGPLWSGCKSYADTHTHILAALNKSLQSLLCGRLIYITIYNSVNSSKWHRPLSKWYCWSVTPVIYTHTHFYETRRFTHVFPSSWNTFQDWGLYLPWTAGRTVEHLSCCTFEEWWYKTWLIALRNYCTKAVFWAFH